MQEGYLEIDDHEKGIQTITATSKAFCLDPSRIYIHCSGGYPRGCVTGGNYNELRHELKHKLMALTFSGEPVIKAVYFREEIFGARRSGPDLYVCRISLI
jgi:predicted AlkP superfamily phosphohydrolase/phosphomutase